MPLEITSTFQTDDRFDIVVCGGGPAGVAAAVSAARKGARTLLLEQGGCLGGFWTRGLLTWLIDTENKDGLLSQLLDRLEQEAEGLRISSPPRFTADTEKTKLVLEKMCLEAGVHILYHTFVCGAVTHEDEITHVLTQSKSGAVAYSGKYFIDTTGDGDLGCFAGASYNLGNEDGLTQPISLIGQFSGVSLSDIVPFDSRKGPGRKPAILREMADAGVSPTYRAPLIAVLSENNELYGLMIHHEYQNGLSAENLTQGTLLGRKELHHIVDALRSKGGIWKNMHLTATADMIGVREGRRLKGLYTLTREDVEAGRQFEDGICTVTFSTDVHNLKPGSEAADKAKYGSSHWPYPIPLRSLISSEISNLLMGGRCISGDFVAHSSYRVAGNAFRTGEAAGLSAAYCLKHRIAPKDIASANDIF